LEIRIELRQASRRLPPSRVNMSFLIKFNLSVVALYSLVFEVRRRSFYMRTAFSMVYTMGVILIEGRFVFLVE
jgi:hypothetical protein